MTVCSSCQQPITHPDWNPSTWVHAAYDNVYCHNTTHMAQPADERKATA